MKFRWFKFLIPDFPRGAIVVTILTSIALLFLFPDVPTAWFWQTMVAVMVILWVLGSGLLAGSSSPDEEDGQKRNPKTYSTHHHIPRGQISSDTAALIHAIEAQGYANRAEEIKEDQGKRLREQITIVLLVITMFAIVSQVIEMRKVYGPIAAQTDAARDQLTLQFPPQLVVNNFIIWPGGHDRSEAPVSFNRGEKISGVTWIANPGRENAFIEKTFCDIYWMKEPLPMLRPFAELQPTGAQILLYQGTGNPATILIPGDIARWDLSTTVPKTIDVDTHLYIMGYVIYRDRLKTRRGVFFARKYDQTLRRFVKATDNPDYETTE